MASNDTVQGTIDAAWDAASSAQEAAEEYAQNAITAASGFLAGGNFSVNLKVPYVEDSFADDIKLIDAEVNKTLNSDLVNLKNSLFGSLVNKDTGLDSVFGPNATFDARDSLDVVHSLASAFNSAFDFGSAGGGMAQSLDDLATFISRGTIYDSAGNLQELQFGLPFEVEDRIYNDAIRQLDKELLRAEQEIVDTFAVRGFPVPPGMLTRAIEEAKQKVLEAKGNAVSQLTIDRAQRGFEAAKHYIAVFRDLQTQTQNYFLQYLQQVLDARKSTSDDMKFLIDAIVSLRQVLIGVLNHANQMNELLLREAIAEEELGNTKQKLAVDEFQARINARVEAAISAARAMGDLAAAAVGSQNTMATIAHETIAREG